MNGAGKWLIVGGVALIVLGALVQSGLLAWFGRLPGDVRIERPGFTFYFPLTTMIVVSAVLSLVIQVVRRLL
jgi:membrane protein implicated in regulation of membrane protease activity